MHILEKEHSRVSKAANRREEWINMVATDPDFIQGKFFNWLIWWQVFNKVHYLYSMKITSNSETSASRGEVG